MSIEIYWTAGGQRVDSGWTTYSTREPGPYWPETGHAQTTEMAGVSVDEELAVSVKRWPCGACVLVG